MSSGEYVSDLRCLMKEKELSAYIIPSEDEHQNENTMECDKRREFISGFNGSAGTAVITLEKAFMWTDGRYFIQAEKQLDPKTWTLMKSGIDGVPTLKDFLLNTFGYGSLIGIDPTQISYKKAEDMCEALKEKGISFIPVEKNLVDQIWKKRKGRTNRLIEHLPKKYSGMESRDKILLVKERIKKLNVDVFVVSDLAEIAWLFNLRGSDIEYSPLFDSYALLTDKETRLYCNLEMLSNEAKESLSSEVLLVEYSDFFNSFSEFKDTRPSIGICFCCCWKISCFISTKPIVLASSPIEALKAVKNETEIYWMKESHVQDGVAFVKFLFKLEECIIKKKSVTESEAAEMLLLERKKRKGFVSPSFETISGYGENSAIIHYRSGSVLIEKDSFYLCDSGGQYLGGTTDVTRTVHFGKPKHDEMEMFTRVLRGNIELNQQAFPSRTTGMMIDSIARRPLWQVCADYMHGTGHGIGSFLNVHEGPHAISYGGKSGSVPLKEGFFVTNEPGVYFEGLYGIRIENVLLVAASDKKGFLSFQCVTVAPIQLNLIDRETLGEENIRWLNNYHQFVFDTLSEHLLEEERAWLMEKTKPL